MPDIVLTSESAQMSENFTNSKETKRISTLTICFCVQLIYWREFCLIAQQYGSALAQRIIMKISKKITLQLAISTFAVLSGSANAALCSNSDVVIDKVGIATSIGTNWSNASPVIDATVCTGATVGNTMPTPSLNLGYSGDGLFNGEKQVSSGLQLYPNGIFSDQYTAINLGGSGDLDPGWIFLGRWENGSFSPAKIGGVGSIVLSNWFSITGTGSSGRWSFTPDVNVASRVTPVLGPNLFDQFVLSFKSGNSFSAYDFTADDLGVPVTSSPIYNFSGTWDMSSTLQNCQAKGKDKEIECESAGLSHVDLYVRDPNGGTNVPEPASLALLGLGLAGLGFSRRKKA